LSEVCNGATYPPKRYAQLPVQTAGISHTGSGRVADIIEIASLVGLYFKISFKEPEGVAPPKTYALLPFHTAAAKDLAPGNLVGIIVTKACALGENSENAEEHRRLTIINADIFLIFPFSFFLL
jgi:hypothetical protein